MSEFYEEEGEYEEEDEWDTCPRCQGSGQVPTADYESYFGDNYKPCPECDGGRFR